MVTLAIYTLNFAHPGVLLREPYYSGEKLSSSPTTEGVWFCAAGYPFSGWGRRRTALWILICALDDLALFLLPSWIPFSAKIVSCKYMYLDNAWFTGWGHQIMCHGFLEYVHIQCCREIYYIFCSESSVVYEPLNFHITTLLEAISSP